MTQLHMLWLPIMLSSAIVFIVSSIIHMLSPWHKSDYPRLSNEEKVLDALRPLDIPPGEYMMPRHVLPRRNVERAEGVQNFLFVRQSRIVTFVPRREHVDDGTYNKDNCRRQHNREPEHVQLCHDDSP